MQTSDKRHGKTTKEVEGTHDIKGTVMGDTEHSHCIQENRGDRKDEARLVKMRKIEMAAITDH